MDMNMMERRKKDLFSIPSQIKRSERISNERERAREREGELYLSPHLEPDYGSAKTADCQMLRNNVSSDRVE